MSCSPQGYGQLNRKVLGRWSAHVLAYTAVHGSVPSGMFVDHECHNGDESCSGGNGCAHRRCCNPSHLVAKSNAENVDAANAVRMRGKFVEHCPAEHPYDEENTGWVWRKRGKGFWERYCKGCNRERQRAR